jgi:ethanolamine utilization protein EutN
MKMGKVVGRVVCSEKISSFEGLKLLLLQPVDEHEDPSGDEIVAIDTVQAGEGDLVMYEGGKEAAQALPNWFNPGDACIIGIMDRLSVDTEALK